MTETSAAAGDARGRLRAAAELLSALDDAAGAAKAHTVHAGALARLGRVAESELALDRALNAAREAGDRRRVTAVLGTAPLAALWGPSPVSRAGGRCLDVDPPAPHHDRLARRRGDVRTLPSRARSVARTDGRRPAPLGASRRDRRGARSPARSAPSRALRRRHRAIANDPHAASRHLHEAYEGFRSMGVGVDAARAAALLARAQLLIGELDEAETVCARQRALRR